MPVKMHTRGRQKKSSGREIQRIFKADEALCVSSLALPTNREKDDRTIC